MFSNTAGLHRFCLISDSLREGEIRLSDFSALFVDLSERVPRPGVVGLQLDGVLFPNPLPAWTCEPRPFDRRMLAQATLFTLHSSPAEPLEPHEIDPTLQMIGHRRPRIQEIGVDLIEFVIPGSKKREIRANIASLGMTRETLFPDVEGLSAQLNYVHRIQVEEFLTRFEKGIKVDPDP